MGLVVAFFIGFRYVRRFFQLILPSLLHFHIAQKSFEENSLLAVQLRRLMLLFSCAAMSISLYFQIVRLQVDTPVTGLYLYLALLAGFLVLCFLKIIGLRILGFFTDTVRPLRLLAYYWQLYLIVGGFFLLPGIVLFFNDWLILFKYLIIFELSVFVILVLLYFFRSLQIFMAAGISIFFWILYLCTFEIVPLLIIYTYFTLR